MPAKNLTVTLTKWVLGGCVVIVIIIFCAGAISSRYARSELNKLIAPSGGSIGDVTVNFFLRRVTLNDLTLFQEPKDASIADSVNISAVVFKGISISQYIFNKKVRINELEIANGSVRLNLATFQNDSAKKEVDLPFKGIHIDKIRIKDIAGEVARDSSKLCEAMISLNIFRISSPEGKLITSLPDYTIGHVDSHVRDLKFHEESGLYNINLNSLRLDSRDETLRLDSLYLLPQHSKYKFAGAAGKQTDRINIFIKNITTLGLRYNMIRDSSFVARSIKISGAEILSFRDKRMPFREVTKKPLPMELLSSVGFPIEIDTITMDNAKVTYEEFPEEGFESAKVIFQNLQATFTNVGNRIYYNKPKFTTLQASAKLMGKANVDATFQMPIGGGNYHAKGKISGFALAHLNPILENLAFMSVESGRLNELDFTFDYTDKESTGSLMINYTGLKIKSLKKQEKEQKNELKSLIINAILKTDKDSNTPEAKRTGEISFERDQKRQIFNYWWKSLLSGISSSVL